LLTTKSSFQATWTVQETSLFRYGQPRDLDSLPVDLVHTRCLVQRQLDKKYDGEWMSITSSRLFVGQLQFIQHLVLCCIHFIRRTAGPVVLQVQSFRAFSQEYGIPAGLSDLPVDWPKRRTPSKVLQEVIRIGIESGDVKGSG
jgi:hypothetical protein